MNQSHPDAETLPRAFVDAWRADRAYPSELRRDYERFLRRREPSRASRLGSVARWVVVGLVVGLGLAQAAALAPWSPSSRPAPAPHARPAPPAPAIRVATPSAVVPPPVAVEEPARSPAATPRRATPPVASVAPLQARWAEAAEALRTNDFVRAERALLAIETSTSGAQRDSARLARAQLLANHGRSSEARRIAEELQTHAASALVREQARNLLEKLATPDRSPRAAEDPK